MRDSLNNIQIKQDKKDKTSNSFKTPIIVGFDPGLTVGLAILDLNGNLLFLGSFKEISKSEIINIIMKFGRAILIATDVENSPKAVKKLATSLNSKIFAPKNDISVSYKNELVNNFLKSNGDFLSENTANISNVSVDAHKRDSLSAAILAYKNYENKLNQLERKFLEAKINLNSIDKEDIVNENYYEILNQAKSFLINDKPIIESIYKAFEIYDLIDNEEDIDSNEEELADSEDNIIDIKDLEEKLYSLKNINKSQEKQIKNQDNIIKKLKSKNNSLANELTEKDNRISKIEKDLKILKLKESKAVLKDKEVASKIKLLKTIQLKYNEEKKLRESLEKKLNKRLKFDDFNELSMFTPIKIIDSFTKNGLKQANNLFKLKRGDVLYFSSSKGGGSQTAKYIVDIGVKAIITSKDNETMSPQAKEVFEKNEVPIINETDLDIKFFDDYAVADTNALNSVIDKWKKSSKQKTIKKAQDDLLNVINEYRVERKRDI